MASTGRFWSLAGVCALAAQAACGVTDEALLVRAGDALSTTGGVTGGGKFGTTGSTTADSGRGGNGGGGGRTTTGGGQSGSLTTGGSTTVPPGPQGPQGPQPPDFDAGASTLTRPVEGLRIVELPFGPIGDASVDASDGFDANFGSPGGGVCAPCAATDQCAVAGAYCVENTRSGERFCTRPCSLDVYCPDYFECVLLSGAPTPQCVPYDRSCGNGSP